MKKPRKKAPIPKERSIYKDREDGYPGSPRKVNPQNKLKFESNLVISLLYRLACVASRFCSWNCPWTLLVLPSVPRLVGRAVPSRLLETLCRPATRVRRPSCLRPRPSLARSCLLPCSLLRLAAQHSQPAAQSPTRTVVAVRNAVSARRLLPAGA